MIKFILTPFYVARRLVLEYLYRRAIKARYPFLPVADAHELAKFLAGAAARGELNIRLTEDAKRGVV